MKTLAIDCSTEACSIALFDGAALVAHDHRILGRGHAEQLVPMVQALPDKGQAERILVALGPGSFTGIRIGIATARALALVWRAEVLGYPTLALVATMARAQAGAQPVDVAMNGGHGEWFVQPFAANGEPLAPVASLVPEEAALAAGASLVAGTQAEAMVERRGSGSAYQLHPDACHALDLPDSLLSPQIQPIYGRAPDAKPAAQVAR
ncbi:tRNA (adenosine(37)-N6)-threonylcarbamoyltransferase complex dimerization subunit type 1 TsaB [Erythrobacter sp. SDW2]|uniref:tRNA (adenosine(37)-N6)-threonylcarbamoyltransferase complex dimerization subunit type 1 TsaB n=1 Tax=Erythrobacter sp. SDW2 TaxID=2907154 RepID=UPI001F28DCAE|nr:tRNA (adenosine(37)-N6)-threonylcarbamoyltransferase complex dimerization subunit type 1 TsaB [Erythrobacter sp. SDW2]UIP08007.1 tRNA (adenosine(37)-N6)-threonylcarbamoyltransferase complex dimerization subunit type 1 TsaB [Erythrobacter sp. SDW2]